MNSISPSGFSTPGAPAADSPYRPTLSPNAAALANRNRTRQALFQASIAAWLVAVATGNAAAQAAALRELFQWSAFIDWNLWINSLANDSFLLWFRSYLIVGMANRQAYFRPEPGNATAGLFEDLMGGVTIAGPRGEGLLSDEYAGDNVGWAMADPERLAWLRDSFATFAAQTTTAPAQVNASSREYSCQAELAMLCDGANP